MDRTIDRASRVQDAFRLLALLDAAGDPPGPGAPAEAVAVVRGQMRFQALDFWLRNPDYLANELINDYEARRLGPDALDLAKTIMASDEPVLHRYPMVRYLFGAYEPLDDALALLRVPGFVSVGRRRRGDRVGLHFYYLHEAGHEALAQVLGEAPDLSWYTERARVVARVAGASGGKALKDRQYRQADYGATPRGSRIAPITSQVQARLAALAS